MKHLCAVLSSLVLAAVLITPQLSHAGGKGDQRKAFMKECLSAKPAKAAAGASQQNKMTTCNKDAKAKNLAGEERKKFMKECLSN
jgi:hypothetical protein